MKMSFLLSSEGKYEDSEESKEEKKMHPTWEFFFVPFSALKLEEKSQK